MSTFSKLRVGPKGASAGVPTLNLVFTVDPTAASSDMSRTLPKGAVVFAVTAQAGATGGVSPTIDVGVTGTTDALANELAVDANTTVAASYTAAADINIVAGVGASAATGGSTQVIVSYFLPDTRNGAND